MWVRVMTSGWGVKKFFQQDDTKHDQDPPKMEKIPRKWPKMGVRPPKKASRTPPEPLPGPPPKRTEKTLLLSDFWGVL